MPQKDRTILMSFELMRPERRRKLTRTKRAITGTDRKRKIDLRDSVSMLVKLGLCIAACAIVLFVCLATAVGQREVSGDEHSADDTEDTFGRLKYVEFPGIAEVFAVSGNADTPVEYSRGEFLSGGKVACFYAQAGSFVCALNSGRVAGVGVDSVYGDYIIIECADGTRAQYSGIAEVLIELGQPIARGDRLGTSGYVLCYSLSEDGELRELYDVFRF
ncbi:MAG: M23 family metallopeptidase [Clostridia bacterium]|nr:M23 family metallopeptidase [Clostridia bacterium]